MSFVDGVKQATVSSVLVVCQSGSSATACHAARCRRWSQLQLLQLLHGGSSASCTPLRGVCMRMVLPSHTVANSARRSGGRLPCCYLRATVSSSMQVLQPPVAEVVTEHHQTTNCALLLYTPKRHTWYTGSTGTGAGQHKQTSLTQAHLLLALSTSVRGNQ